MCLNIGLYAYIADTTTTQNRTWRMSILTGIFSLGYVIGVQIGGRIHSYVVIFTLALGLSFLGFFYSILVLEESLQKRAATLKYLPEHGLTSNPTSENLSNSSRISDPRSSSERFSSDRSIQSSDFLSDDTPSPQASTPREHASKDGSDDLTKGRCSSRAGAGTATVEHVFGAFRSLFRARPGRRRYLLLASLFQFQAFMLCLNTTEYDYLMTRLKFAWERENFSNYLTVQRICRIVGRDVEIL